ncbi:hypothetical protein PR048_016972 [Dryococelus australis]|uniref:Uncharacterized protein n=1 Tax=Dryococelus australis TaxID=614101 RepID=A0ABQ9H871_9NEOP|nr:hypothetical protein PR048_016972 [Dryococelus australis]
MVKKPGIDYTVAHKGKIYFQVYNASGVTMDTVASSNYKDTRTHKTHEEILLKFVVDPTWANRVLFPAGSPPGFSHMGLMLDDAAGRRVFSGISRFPSLFHSGAAPYSTRFTLIGSQDLDEAVGSDAFIAFVLLEVCSHLHSFKYSKKNNVNRCTDFTETYFETARYHCEPGSIPVVPLPDFRMWKSCRTMPLVGGFSRESPVSPALSFRRFSVLTSITFMDSQDLTVKGNGVWKKYTDPVSELVGAARPRSEARSNGAIRATLTRMLSVSSLLRARRAVFPSTLCCAIQIFAQICSLTYFTLHDYAHDGRFVRICVHLSRNRGRRQVQLGTNPSTGKHRCPGAPDTSSSAGETSAAVSGDRSDREALAGVNPRGRDRAPAPRPSSSPFLRSRGRCSYPPCQVMPLIISPPTTPPSLQFPRPPRPAILLSEILVWRTSCSNIRYVDLQLERRDAVAQVWTTSRLSNSLIVTFIQLSVERIHTNTGLLWAVHGKMSTFESPAQDLLVYTFRGICTFEQNFGAFSRTPQAFEKSRQILKVFGLLVFLSRILKIRYAPRRSNQGTSSPASMLAMQVDFYRSNVQDMCDPGSSALRYHNVLALRTVASTFDDFYEGRGGRAVSLLASDQGEQGSVPSRVTGFLHVGIVPDDAVGLRVFLRISRSPCPFIPEQLHTPSVTLVGSQDLVGKSRPNLFNHSQFYRSVPVSALRMIALRGASNCSCWSLRHQVFFREKISGPVVLQNTFPSPIVSRLAHAAFTQHYRLFTEKLSPLKALLKIPNRKFRWFEMNFISISSPALNSNGGTVFCVDLRPDLGSSFESRWCNRALFTIMKRRGVPRLNPEPRRRAGRHCKDVNISQDVAFLPLGGRNDNIAAWTGQPAPDVSNYQTWYGIWPYKAGNAMTGATRIPATMADLAQSFTESAVSLLASHQGDPGTIPCRAIPDSRMWESCRTRPSVGRYSQGSPASPGPSFLRCSMLISITLIGSQDLDLKTGYDGYSNIVPLTLSVVRCPQYLIPSTLASHQDEAGSIPGRVIPDSCKWESCRKMPFVGCFLGDLPLLPPYSSQSPSSALKTSILRAVRISSVTHTLWIVSSALTFVSRSFARIPDFSAVRIPCNVPRIGQKKAGERGGGEMYPPDSQMMMDMLRAAMLHAMLWSRAFLVVSQLGTVAYSRTVPTNEQFWRWNRFPSRTVVNSRTVPANELNHLQYQNCHSTARTRNFVPVKYCSTHGRRMFFYFAIFRREYVLNGAPGRKRRCNARMVIRSDAITPWLINMIEIYVVSLDRGLAATGGHFGLVRKFPGIVSRDPDPTLVQTELERRARGMTLPENVTVAILDDVTIPDDITILDDDFMLYQAALAFIILFFMLQYSTLTFAILHFTFYHSTLAPTILNSIIHALSVRLDIRDKQWQCAARGYVVHLDIHHPLHALSFCLGIRHLVLHFFMVYHSASASAILYLISLLGKMELESMAQDEWNRSEGFGFPTAILDYLNSSLHRLVEK